MIEKAPRKLEARGLRVSRGGRVILRGVDLDASAGEVVGVLGPSGAGKSTLFRALVGEELADEGTVMLCGQDVTHWPLWKRARAGVGFIPQGPSVLWELTVRQNLETFQAIAGQRPVHANLTYNAALRVGLEHRLDVRAGQLSAGERRRLEFARAVTRPPTVLVCDEPFAGVDPAGAERLGNLLRALAEGGAIVILADHHVAEALRVCTNAILLLDGEVAAAAPAGEFANLAIVRGRYLGTWSPGTSERAPEVND
ncbi:MAG: ABC transporter ATP-binding protein [Polyangiaceae bacterium]|jgi:lipopolysaccharide export system ATP-binding protein